MCWPFRGKPKPPPTTSPVPVSNPVVVRDVPTGTSVYCGWETPRSEYGAVPGVQCSNPLPWSTIKTKDRAPAISEYNEADPAVTKWRLEQMEKAGLTFCTYQVEWAHEWSNLALIPAWRSPKLKSPLINAHCADNHPEDSPVQFAISLWDVSAGDPLWQEMKANGWTSQDVEDSWGQFAHTIANLYMVRPNYFHIKGRPVLFRGYAENLRFYEKEFGVTPKRIIDIVRYEVKATTDKDLYLVATATDPPFRPQLKAIGFDCLTEYLLHGKDWQSAQGTYRYWWAEDLKLCKAQGLDYIVPATCGYDARAWPGSTQNVAIPTAAEYTAHMKEALALARANPDICLAVNSYSWSEFGEGGILEPQMPGMLHEADEMIHAHRAALTI